MDILNNDVTKIIIAETVTMTQTPTQNKNNKNVSFINNSNNTQG